MTGSTSGWLRWPIALVALPLLGLVMVFLGELVPDDLIIDSLVNAIEDGEITEENRSKSFLGHTADHHSECIGLTTGLEGNDRGFAEVALANPTLGSCSSTVELIDQWQEEGVIEPAYDYLRYWHSHTLLIRPTFALMGVQAVRVVIGAILLLSAATFFVVVRARTSTVPATFFTLPLIISTDLAVSPLGGPHGLAAATVFLGAAASVWLVTKDPRLSTIAVVSSAAAGLVVLVDVFTMGTLSWVTTVGAVCVATWSLGFRAMKLAVGALISAGAWGIGYATTWITKWILAGMVVGFQPVVETVTEQIAFRATGEVDYITLGLGRTTAVVVEAWIQTPIGLATATITLIWMLTAIVQTFKGGSWWTLLVLWSPAILALIWFELLQNHTQIHRWFAGPRGMGAMAAVLLVGSELVRRNARSSRAEPAAASSVST